MSRISWSKRDQYWTEDRQYLILSLAHMKPMFANKYLSDSFSKHFEFKTFQ